MKESTKKIINHLSQYVGAEIIRTKPSCGDWSFTDHPLLLVGFTPTDCIKCRFSGAEVQIFGKNEFILPTNYTDYNWISYKKALKAEENELNKWRGKKIRRICPTAKGDKSFMDLSEAPFLVSASKYHIVVQDKYDKYVLNSDFANPDDWKLAEAEG